LVLRQESKVWQKCTGIRTPLPKRLQLFPGLFPGFNEAAPSLDRWEPLGRSHYTRVRTEREIWRKLVVPPSPSVAGRALA
jgi:hypothetical protein